MAGYCEPEDLGRLAVNRDALADLSNQEDIQPAIDSAAAEMAGFFRGRWTMPLVSWSSDVTRCNAVLAAYIALTTRGLKPGENPEDDQLVKEVTYYRTKWLPGVAAGTIHPVVVDSGVVVDPGGSALGGRPVVASNVQRGFFAEDPRRAYPFQGRRRL